MRKFLLLGCLVCLLLAGTLPVAAEVWPPVVTADGLCMWETGIINGEGRMIGKDAAACGVDGKYLQLSERAIKGAGDSLWAVNAQGIPQTWTHHAFVITAYASASTDGDGFKLHVWGDSGAVDVLFTATTPTRLVIPLPDGVGNGLVAIAITDTSETPGTKALDSLYIDDMRVVRLP